VERLANDQTLRYATALRELYSSEWAQRREAEETLKRLTASYGAPVRVLAAALELRDDETGRHAERVTELALLLTARVEPDLLADPQLEYGFFLHDLGKIGVPDAVLLKPAALTEGEFEQIRVHPALGERIVGEVPYLSGTAKDVVGSHHERWDGSGYPRGLTAGAIPLAARIFAVVDAYDAITNDRPYRVGRPPTVAVNELIKGAGAQFDPEIVREFVALVGELERETA
jgi:HD-GYP domain-containing protein (c-di-GMP phosphodiesterase class II)